jgi:hypothetical protein
MLEYVFDDVSFAALELPTLRAFAFAVPIMCGIVFAILGVDHKLHI